MVLQRHGSKSIDFTILNIPKKIEGNNMSGQQVTQGMTGLPLGRPAGQKEAFLSQVDFQESKIFILNHDE